MENILLEEEESRPQLTRNGHFLGLRSTENNFMIKVQIVPGLHQNSQKAPFTTAAQIKQQEKLVLYCQ